MKQKSNLGDLEAKDDTIDGPDWYLTFSSSQIRSNGMFELVSALWRSSS